MPEEGPIVGADPLRTPAVARMPDGDQPDIVLNISETARQLGIPEETVINFFKRGGRTALWQVRNQIAQGISKERLRERVINFNKQSLSKVPFQRPGKKRKPW